VRIILLPIPKIFLDIEMETTRIIIHTKQQLLSSINMMLKEKEFASPEAITLANATEWTAKMLEFPAAMRKLILDVD